MCNYKGSSPGPSILNSTGVLHQDARIFSIVNILSRAEWQKTLILVIPNPISCVIHNKRIRVGFNH
jgi:hypothetical protein